MSDTTYRSQFRYDWGTDGWVFDPTLPAIRDNTESMGEDQLAALMDQMRKSADAWADYIRYKASLIAEAESEEERFRLARHLFRSGFRFGAGMNEVVQQ